jgi:hypothetical protein
MPAPLRPIRISLAILYFASISAIVGWSQRDGAAASQPAGPPPKPAATERDRVVAPENAPPAGKVRAGGNCSECGVVESVRHVDTYVEIMEGCRPSETTGSLGHDYGLASSRRGGVEPLADIVSAAAGKRGAKRFAVTTRHQIIVRFRDGRRQVLNEATPRALHEGERVIVIAGVGKVNG